MVFSKYKVVDMMFANLHAWRNRTQKNRPFINLSIFVSLIFIILQLVIPRAHRAAFFAQHTQPIELLYLGLLVFLIAAELFCFFLFRRRGRTYEMMPVLLLEALSFLVSGTQLFLSATLICGGIMVILRFGAWLWCHRTHRQDQQRNFRLMIFVDFICLASLVRFLY